MSPFHTWLLVTCILLYFTFLVYDWIIFKRTKALLFQLIGLLFGIVLLRLYFGFPTTTTAFGVAPSLLTNFVLLICIILGIVSSHIFSREPFRVLEWLRHY